MKRFILSLLFTLTSIICFGQIITNKDLEVYSCNKFGKDWGEASLKVKEFVDFDKNRGITFVEVVEAEGKTKDEIYMILNYWFTASFVDANSVIKLNDRAAGVIIARGFVEGVAQHIGDLNNYNVSLNPIIKCDIKDEKVRITYTIPYYSVSMAAGGGSITMALGGNTKNTPIINSKWMIDECYHFVEKDKHKKTSCKALVMSFAYSNVIIDKIRDAIESGLIGNEDDEW